MLSSIRKKHHYVMCQGLKSRLYIRTLRPLWFVWWW